MSHRVQTDTHLYKKQVNGKNQQSMYKHTLTSTTVMLSKSSTNIKLLFTHKFNVMAMESKSVFKI